MHNYTKVEQRMNMAGKYIKRALEPVLQKAAKEFPAVVLTGPRQSGKTTILKHLFGRTHRYVSLETGDVQAADRLRFFFHNATTGPRHKDPSDP
jgi:hypothetical protein